MREALGEVAELPQMQRAAIFLTAVDGQTHDEVADALGISHGALRGLLYRARVTLRSAAAALTPSPLLAWGSNGTGAAAPSAERLAELAAGGGAGFAGVLLKGAVVAVTAGALATGSGVVANHAPESVTRRHGAAGAAPLAVLTGSHERRSAVSAASTVALVELRSTRTRHRVSASHGKRATGGQAQHGERPPHGGSRDGVVHGERVDSSPRNEGGEGGGPRGGGDGENAGFSASSGSQGGASQGGASQGGASQGGASGQAPSGDRHSGSDSSQTAAAEVAQAPTAEVVQPAAPTAGQAPGGQAQTGGGRGDGAGSSSDVESSHSDG